MGLDGRPCALHIVHMGGTNSSSSLPATHPAIRRILALLTFNRLVSAEASAATVNAWRSLGASMDRLANELRLSDDDRSEWFRALSNAAYANARSVLRVVHGRRPGHGVTHATAMPRSWTPAGRVIDVEGMVSL